MQWSSVCMALAMCLPFRGIVMGYPLGMLGTRLPGILQFEDWDSLSQSETVKTQWIAAMYVFKVILLNSFLFSNKYPHSLGFGLWWIVEQKSYYNVKHRFFSPGRLICTVGRKKQEKPSVIGARVRRFNTQDDLVTFVVTSLVHVLQF